jgi:restriction system protein
MHELENRALIRQQQYNERREYFKEIVRENVKEHITVLAIKKKQKAKYDDYGNMDYSEWDKEKRYFTDNVINKKENLNLGYNLCFSIIEDEIALHNDKSIESYGYSDSISGVHYEVFCSEQLKSNGWKCNFTRTTGDQGVDILAIKDKQLVAIQCKKSSTPIGNKAVQEVFAGSLFYKTNMAIVVTNNSYTQSAKQLAIETNTYLLHHDDLVNL